MEMAARHRRFDNGGEIMRYDIMIYLRDEDAHLTSSAIIDAIKNWESSYGITLPKDYRDFLISVIGGLPFPGCFDLQLEQLPDFLDENTQEIFEFYSWEEVERTKETKEYYNGYPEGYLIIADVVSPIYLLIGVRADNYGKLYLWYHSTVDWGSDVNNEKESCACVRFISPVYEYNL